MERSDFLRMLGVASAAGLGVGAPSGGAAASEFAQAKARVQRIQARDDASILFGARTNCYDHGRQTPLVVVLFHGFTNNPIQFARLAAALYAGGCNVLVPRLPGHGDVDRMTTRLESVTADELTCAAQEAIDAARGLGVRVAVSGISLGGALCAWLATRRADIDRCVCIAPALGLNKLSYAVDRLVVHALTSLPPTAYAWWDPHLKERMTPKHAYPRYPLRVLGECYRIGDAVISARGPFPGRGHTEAIFVDNPRDGAVNNTLTKSTADGWRESDWLATDVIDLDGAPPFHDIVEPQAPGQRIDIVYPKLIEYITKPRSS